MTSQPRYQESIEDLSPIAGTELLPTFVGPVSSHFRDSSDSYSCDRNATLSKILRIKKLGSSTCLQRLYYHSHAFQHESAGKVPGRHRPVIPYRGSSPSDSVSRPGLATKVASLPHITCLSKQHQISLVEEKPCHREVDRPLNESVVLPRGRTALEPGTDYNRVLPRSLQPSSWGTDRSIARQLRRYPKLIVKRS